MTFTTRGEAVDLKIKEQLNLVCKELKANISDIQSIILAGSFGYGEGPVKVKNNQIFPFNDYDLYVITEKPVPKTRVDEIASLVASKLGLKGIKYFYDFKKQEQTLEKNFYIDLKILTKKQVSRLLPRLRFYKFQKYTQIIEGYDLRHLFPDIELSKIPLSEPAKLLLDRMSQMIEYYSTEKNYDEYFLTYIIQQAYAAMSTSLTMLAKNFSPSYKENMEFLVEHYLNYFSELNQYLPKLHLRIKKYIEWKLNPQKLPHKNTEEAWKICANDLLEVTKYFLSRFLNKNIKTTNQLSKEILKMPKKFYTPYINHLQKQKTKLNLSPLIRLSFPLLSFYLKHKYYNRLNKKFKKVYLNKYSPDAYIFASAPYIISAIAYSDMTRIEKAKQLLSKVYPVKAQNWEELSVEYAHAYVAFFLQSFD